MDDRAVMRTLQDDAIIESWVCQFFGEPFPYDVHPEVIRHHLTWKCERAPEDVQEAAERSEEDEFSVSVEGTYNNNFNTETEDSRNAGREVEAAECSRSVKWVRRRVLDASENRDSNFEAETDSNIVQRSNKRQRTTPPDALPIAAAFEVPNYSFGEDESGLSGNLPLILALFVKKVAERRAHLMELHKAELMRTSFHHQFLSHLGRRPGIVGFIARQACSMHALMLFPANHDLLCVSAALGLFPLPEP